MPQRFSNVSSDVCCSPAQPEWEDERQGMDEDSVTHKGELGISNFLWETICRRLYTGLGAVGRVLTLPESEIQQRHKGNKTDAANSQRAPRESSRVEHASG